MKYTGRVSTPKERKKTPNDVIMTNPNTAKWIVDYFQPTGKMLEPCRGDGAFYNELQNHGDTDWCELTEGKDFLDYNGKVDWIITNPPFSIFDAFLLKSFEIADNIVFFCPLTKVFKGKRLDIKICEYGGIKEIIHMGGGNQHGFPFGFSTGCIHYQKNYKENNIKLIRNYK
ncbi:MAG: hypothetical protein CBE21_00715 [Proteobacteria bacterium TMED261]|nr:MAG: hypothetical protein CBE21_00715 [Proteobacteria bacterium TMED261]|tara:strand:+ start:1154 stop:1669 length:516 start_codon:yes stop_codon:yes gene_type:complete